jgi:1,2-phenylacetyl-CoA epoxidase PaaB subunit
MPRFSIDTTGKAPQHIGTVVAENEREALEVAIEKFRIRPALRSKVVVTKVADKD